MLVSLPEALISFSVRGAAVAPHFLGEHDHPWLRVLLEEYERFVDRPRRELDQHLAGPLPCAAPEAKKRLALHVLSRLWADRRGGLVPPPRARAALFAEAARSAAPRDVVLARVADGLGVTGEGLETSLFADLPGERLVGAPPGALSAQELALRTNQAIAQALLFRSTAVRIELQGNARSVVRHARLRGLICTVAPGEGSDRAAIELSGPFALFRRTLLYGRSLAELLPLVAWCHHFRLTADCVLREQSLVLELRTGDPIFPSAAPRLYDSRLEERFARDFRRAAPDWDVVREPEPIEVGGKLLFPDFALTNRIDGRRWLLEIVGFWTPEYVARKLAAYRAARRSNLVLCVDEARRCAAESLAPDARVLFFRRRVDARAVLAALEGGGR